MGERQFGPYRLVKQIAVGGMAEIHLAKTRGIAGFEKYVALKMIHPNFSEDENFVQMLIDEAKITVLLQHVNVAQTFDLGRVGSTYYITMEYVDGADLYQILRRGSERDYDFPIDAAAYIAKEVATGLDYAHRKRDPTGKPLNIVHRDISPQNVLISYQGEVKLVDFGIAKASMRARQTAAGVIKGKYYYMSPEQAWGEPVDSRTDIFSTGILLYEMLTGQMLYLEEDLHKLLDMVRKAEIDPPTRLRPDVPIQLEKIVMRALSKNKEDRYPTANDFATDLERFLHGYSPVFRAPKVAAYVRKVQDIDDTGFATAAPVAPVQQSSSQTLSGNQFVRERAELTDENSVIFRIDELKPPKPVLGPDSKSRDLQDKTGEVSVESKSSGAAFPGARQSDPGQKRSANKRLASVPKLKARDANEDTKSIGANVDQMLAARDGTEDTQIADGFGTDDNEDETVITAEPFPDPAGGTGRRGAGDMTKPAQQRPVLSKPAPTLGEDSEERTIVDQKFSAKKPSGKTHNSASDDAPTLEGNRVTPIRPTSASTARTLIDDDIDEDTQAPTSFSSRPRKRTHPPPIPPALVASNPQPAVSALTPPRKSRRTPPGGVPNQGPSGGSLLSQIVSGGGAPEAPAGMPITRTRGGAPAQNGAPPLMGGQAAMPGGFEQGPIDGTTTPWNASGLPVAPHDMSSGMNPAINVGMNPGIYSPFPQGAMPITPSGQFAALEVDEIPEAFKLNRQAAARNKRLALFIVALLACVGMGVALGIVIFGRGEAPLAEKELSIVSIPSGARVFVDGQELADTAPTSYPKAIVGNKYIIGLKLPGYAERQIETVVSQDRTPVVKVIATLEPISVKLTVTSVPKGATVLIDGTPRGTTPLVLSDLNPTQVPNVEVRLKGFRPERQSIDWSDNTEQTIAFELER